MTKSLLIAHASNATVTDRGRVAGPQVGLPVNGALDQYSAQVANVLALNLDDAPLIEMTLSDCEFTANTDIIVAVTGAAVTVLVDEELQAMWAPFLVRSGQHVAVYQHETGLRTYIAVHGGFNVPQLLGSCAPDTVIGFGHALREGTELELAQREIAPITPGSVGTDLSLFDFDVLVPYFGGEAVVDVVDGPDSAQFGATARRIFQRPFEVTPNSNHVGLRLSGELPVRTDSTEMVSRGVPVGAVEVPPGDELVVLHRGRGVTAGYPVLGVATPISLDVLGQVRPGQRVQFRRSTVEEAQGHARNWQERVQLLRRRTQRIFSILTD